MEGITKRFGNLVGGLKNTWNNITGGVNAVRNFVQAEPQQINPVVQTPVTTQAPVVSPIQTKPLYVNGITSDPAEMAKNRNELATSISNLSPQPVTNFNLANNDNTYDSSSINTGVTRQDVINRVNTMQSDFANGNIPDGKPTSGYQKFITDYSNAVQYSPEQQAAYKGQQQTASAIADIQRNLQNRQAELTQNGALSPAQVAADMKQYTTEANSRIADLQASNRDYTLTFNALENARQNTLQAFGVQAPFYKPTEISPGSQIIDPSTGKSITQGTGVSPSTAASYASQLFNDDLKTGTQKLTTDGQVDTQYYYQKASQILGGVSSNTNISASSGTSLGTTGAGVLPQSLQPYVYQTQDGSSYIDENKIPAAQKDFIKQQAAINGIPFLTTENITKFQNIINTQSNLDDLQSVVQKINGPGLKGRTIGALWNTMSGFLQTNPDISAFNSWRDTAINTIQALAGGSGSGFRLNQAEIDTATKNLPTITDNLETANNKLNIVKGFLGKWKSTLLTGSPTANAEKLVQTTAGPINTNW